MRDPRADGAGLPSSGRPPANSAWARVVPAKLPRHGQMYSGASGMCRGSFFVASLVAGVVDPQWATGVGTVGSSCRAGRRREFPSRESSPSPDLATDFADRADPDFFSPRREARKDCGSRIIRRKLRLAVFFADFVALREDPPGAYSVSPKVRRFPLHSSIRVFREIRCNVLSRAFACSVVSHLEVADADSDQ